MGIFFKSQAMLPTVAPALEEALKADPANIPNPKQEAANRASQVAQQISGEFSWARLSVAIVLLVAVFGAGLYTAQHNLEEWSKVLLHSFELILGLVLGLLGGEAAARR